MQTAILSHTDENDEGNDEEENFEQEQRTNRNDDLDFFSKLMR